MWFWVQGNPIQTSDLVRGCVVRGIGCFVINSLMIIWVLIHLHNILPASLVWRLAWLQIQRSWFESRLSITTSITIDTDVSIYIFRYIYIYIELVVLGCLTEIDHRIRNQLGQSKPKLPVFFLYRKFRFFKNTLSLF